MPELPEVQTIVSQLASAITGATMDRVHARRSKVFRTALPMLQKHLPGCRIERVTREGKRILIQLTGPATLVIHLGMSGRLVIAPTQAPLSKHTHLRVRLRRPNLELRYIDPRMFGGVWFFNGQHAVGQCSTLKPLGPDALTIRASALRGLLRRRRQIKALLLDQQAISGMGNIYTDEALFAVRIHPRALTNTLSEKQAQALAGSIRRVLRASIAQGGTTMSDYRDAQGKHGAFWDRLKVYGREGQPCPRCQGVIERIIVAGRSTHVCPHCQPE